jgi:polyadenylate-binding protein
LGSLCFSKTKIQKKSKSIKMSKGHSTASLYVGDLAPDVTEGILFEFFNQVGQVNSIRVCRDALTRRSLGYAYVNFNTVLDAERAIDILNNLPIKGKPCRIMWSQRDPRLRKSGVGNIFIKNLDPSIGHKELQDIFSTFGNILSCKVALNEKNESKGFGFVHFETPQSAESAIEKLNDKIIGEKRVFVGHFIPKREREKNNSNTWTNLYVKPLDQDCNDKALHEIFSQFGEIDNVHVVLEDTGKAKGFGYVNFKNHEDAIKAVDSGANLKNYKGEPLYVVKHLKRPERTLQLKRQAEEFKSKYAQSNPNSNLYLKNLEDSINEDFIKHEFSRFGNVKNVKIMLDEFGNSKGFGFVSFSNSQEATEALHNMNGRTFPGCRKPLYVGFHERKELRRQKLAQSFSQRKSRPIFSPPLYYPGAPPPNIHQSFYPSIYPPRSRPWNASPPASSPYYPFPPPQTWPLPSRNIDNPVRDQLGKRLLSLIEQRHPQSASKLTGMILDDYFYNGKVDELSKLLEDEEKLNLKIESARSKQ